MRATLSTAATVLTLGLWLGGLSCHAERRCVDIDVVASGAQTSAVPFRSGMEVEFLHERLANDTEKTINIGFYIVEDGNETAKVYVKEDGNNELKKVSFIFRTDNWGTPIKNAIEGSFNVGILRRVRLEYSEGLYKVAVWDKDRQRNKTWSSKGDPTKGQGNLTIFARIPDHKTYSSVVYWPRTCPPAPLPRPHPQASVADTPSLLYICVLAALAVTSLVLLALLCWQLRRTFGQPKAKNEDLGVQREEGSEGRRIQGPPLRHRSQEERDDSEGRDSINSIYGYIPRD